MRTHTHWAVAAAAVAGLALAACGGSSKTAGDPMGPPEPTEPEPTETEAQKAQKKALMDAAFDPAALDLSTEAMINAAKAKIMALEAALTAAVDVSEADKKTYQTQRDNAQKAVDRKEQMNALRSASEALQAALTAVTGVTPTTDQLTAAVTAIKDLRAKLNETEDLTQEEKAEYQQELTRAEGRGLEDKRAAAIAKTIKDGAIMAAGNAVGMVTNTSAESTVTDAQKKIDAAKAAIEAADILEAEKEKLRAALAVHEGALGGKKTSRTRAMAVKRIQDGQIAAAMSAVGMVKRDSSRESVTDAEAKLEAAKTAIDDAENLSADQKTELRAELTRQRSALTTAKAGRKAFAEAMFKSLQGPADDGSKDAQANLALDALYRGPWENPNKVLSGTGKPSGLTLDMAQGAGTLLDSDYESAVTFTKEEVVKTVDGWQIAALAKWKVSDLTESRDDKGDQRDGLDKFHDRVRVWNNRPEKYDALAADYFDNDLLKPAVGGTHTKAERRLSLTTGIDAGIASPHFQSAGSEDMKPSDPSTKEIRLRGTFHGAPGWYRCTYSTAASCRVSTAKGGHHLADAWEFVYDEDARVNRPGLHYVYFGWWVREDVSGRMPRMATVFIGKEGDGIESPSDGTSLSGTATFEGPAGGVYAIHDPLRGKGEAGEFEAVARLEALFGDVSASNNPVDRAGMTGTVSQFRLNGGSGDPGWTLTLEKNSWASGAKIDDRTDSVVWSINGVKGAVAGKWSGRMYDTTVGESIGGSDGDGQPDVVIGTFYSEHGTTHRLVGAFGAKNITKQYDN